MYSKHGMQMGRHSKRVKRSLEGPVEELPLEIIGEILSRVRAARDVIKASLTCKKWRDAYCKHLHALSFDIADRMFVGSRVSVRGIELLITKTIFQTTALRKLSILMDFGWRYSASTVGTWLLFVRETLTELFYEVGRCTRVNVLDMFGRRKLETLSLSKYRIGKGELSFERFACLTSLSLCKVSISVEDLNRFLNAPPKLEYLKLDSPSLRASNSEHSSYSDDSSDSDDSSSPGKVVKLHCPTLKTLLLGGMKLYQFIVESISIESLEVEECEFSSFKVYSSKTLRDIKVSKSEARLLEIEQTDNLESFEFTRSHVTESNLFPMILQAPKLKRFRFWGCWEEDVDLLRGDGRPRRLDLERMAICSPQLSHLAIFYSTQDIYYSIRLGGLAIKFGGSTTLEKVMVLEIGWTGFDDGFAEWTEKLVKCCPNVEKLIVHWVLKEHSSDSLNVLSVQSSLLVKMMSKYQHIKMQFAFHYDYDFD